MVPGRLRATTMAAVLYLTAVGGDLGGEQDQAGNTVTQYQKPSDRRGAKTSEWRLAGRRRLEEEGHQDLS